MTDLKAEGGETQNKTSDDSKGFYNVGHSFKHHMFNIICTHKKFWYFKTVCKLCSTDAVLSLGIAMEMDKF